MKPGKWTENWRNCTYWDYMEAFRWRLLGMYAKPWFHTICRSMLTGYSVGDMWYVIHFEACKLGL